MLLSGVRVGVVGGPHRLEGADPLDRFRNRANSPITFTSPLSLIHSLQKQGMEKRCRF